jgi:hypothetical protein
MFAQMRSRDREPCPCGGICECHKPAPKVSFSDIGWSLFAGLVFIGGMLLLRAEAAWENRQVQHIEVNGQICEMKWQVDGVHSWGASYGHNYVVCQKQGEDR